MTDYTTHPDYRAMLAGIRADKADDLKRLVLADWLDEHGQAERAELIRIQCRIAEMTRTPDEAAIVPQHLKQKQAELIALHGHQWATIGVINSPAGVVWINSEERETETRPVCEWSRGFLHTVRGPLASLIGGECGRCGGESGYEYDSYRTGTLMTVDCPCPQCRGTGRTVGVLPALVRDGVIERVEVTDREPTLFGQSSYVWSTPSDYDPSGRHRVPVFLFNAGVCLTKFFHTRESAVSALSAALIAWAESEGEK